MPTEPRVSVVMPVYNGLPHLDATIESILNQTDADFEFVIVDDCSRDGSWDSVQEWARRDPRIRAHRQPRNSGHRAASNQGFSLARGRFVARTDQDDLSAPLRIERQAAFLERHPEVGVLGCAYHRLHPDGTLTAHHPAKEHAELRWGLLFGMVFPHSALFFRREVLGGRGAYRFAPAAYDYEVCARLSLRSRIAALPEPLVTYRMQEGGMSVRQRGRMDLSATAISARLIRPLLAPRRLSRGELESIRRWAAPGSLRGEDLAAGPYFLELLERFGRLPDIGEVAARRIRRRWIHRLARGLRPGLWPAFLRTPTAGALLREEPIVFGRSLLLELPRRGRARLRRGSGR